MTIDDKNRIRLRVRMVLLAQWMIVLFTGLIAGMLGSDTLNYAAILTASTSGMTAGLAMDYYTKASDNSK